VNQSPDDRSTGRRRFLLLVLYCVLFISFVFMVWQVWDFCSRRLFSPSPERTETSRREFGGRSKDKPNVDFTDLSKGKVEGIMRLRVRPPAPPHGSAVELFALGRESYRKGWVDLQWCYKSNGQLDEVMNYYRKSLANKGFDYVDTASRDPLRRTMVFRKKKVIVRIILRISEKEAKILKQIILVVFRPEEHGDFIDDPRGES